MSAPPTPRHHLTPAFILAHDAAGRHAGELEAFVAFVDISGFTPLTLALMKHGTEGAEVLAEVLVAVFEPLIETVYAYGGFIAGFAGDAFKALFPCTAPDAAFRAVSAGWRMAEMLNQTPPYSTRFGTFAFAGKVCLAQGVVRWEIWQDQARARRADPVNTAPADRQRAAYVFSGPAITAAMQLDPLAARGEIVITAEIAARLELPHRTTIRDGCLRLDALDAAVPPAAPADPAEDGAARGLALASHFFPASLLLSSTQGEFRQVTTAFVNLAGTSDAREQHAFVADFFRLLHQYDGYLCRVGSIGGKDNGSTFLLFWGAPAGSERDVDRALGFLLDLQAVAPVVLRAGVTTQLAYAGFVGSPRREEYTCYGSYVNLAARQLIAADWDEIWLDETTVTQASGFSHTPHGRHRFKGFATAQPVFRLRGRREPDRAFADVHTLRGREEEVAQLLAALAPLTQGRFGGAIRIIGEAGIGKSRLVHEVRQRIQQTWPAPTTPVIHTLQTDEILRQAFNPFRHWLRRLFQVAQQEDAATRAARFHATFQAMVDATPAGAPATELQRTKSFLGALLDIFWEDSLYSRLEPDLRYENTLNALTTLVEVLSRQQPLVLHVEDVHWLDAESRDVLERLLRNPRGAPFAVLMTARPPEEGDIDAATLVPAQVAAQTITLATLPPDAVRALAAEALGGPIAPDLAARLVQQGDGNPFFTEQIVLYLREQGLLRRVDGTWRLAETMDAETQTVLLSRDVRTVLTARLDRLEPALMHAVQTAAVLGRDFHAGVLRQMLAASATPAASHADLFAAGQTAGIWTLQGEAHVVFRHALLRDAAYDMQLRARLRGLHHTAARAIEDVFANDLPPRYADLVYHYHRSEDRAQERSYARLAGMRAAEQFANDDAIRYLSRALALTPPADHAAQRDLLRRRAEVFNIAGRRDAQTDDLAQLLALAQATGDAADVADALLRRADYARVVADYAHAEGLLAQAVPLAQAAGDTTLRAKINSCWGQVLWRQGKYGPARDLLHQAFDDARLAGARHTGAADMPADIHYQLGCVDYYEHKYADALRRFQTAHELYQAAAAPKGSALCLSMFGAVHYQAGRYAESQAAYLQSLEISNALGWRHTSAFLYGLLGTNDLDMGAFAQAQHNHEQALQLCIELGDREGEGVSLDALGLIEAMRGRADQALAFYARAEAVQRAIGDRRSLAYTLTHAGHAHVQCRAYAAAYTAFAQAVAIRTEPAEEATRHDSRAGLALVHHLQGEHETAYAAATEIAAWLDAHDPTELEYPAQVFLICARIIAARKTAHAQTQARRLLRTGRALITARAAAMGGEEARQRYLHAIPFHRELLATAPDDDAPDIDAPDVEPPRVS